MQKKIIHILTLFLLVFIFQLSAFANGNIDKSTKLSPNDSVNYVFENEEETSSSFGESLQKKMDGVFGYLVGKVAPILFYNIPMPSINGEISGTKNVKFFLNDGQSPSKVWVLQDNLEENSEIISILEEKNIPFEVVDTARFSEIPNSENVTVIAETTAGMPFVVLFLIVGAIFYTIYFKFINFRAFKHAIDVTRGKYDSPDDHGEVSHFQALSSALSATVGLGNIAGVAVAVAAGGPGAVFWMIVAATFGMTSKFVECTLGQKYREVKPDGTVAGGPMYYLEKGLAEKNMKPFGKFLAVIFAIFCILGSFGGGNMFQANQSYVAVAKYIPIPKYVYGIVLALLVGAVIIGGIKRIASVAEKIVPFMCGMYVFFGILILLFNFSSIPEAFGRILSSAFNPQAIGGGFFGVLVQGFKRAAFSNEAGIGSASIAHSAAKTEEPVREGIVALLEPFIDTIIVCTMTGLVITITNAWQLKDANGKTLEGIDMTSAAFASNFSWFPVILTIAVVLFAFSTMVSWSYYGEKSWEYLFGSGSVMVYKFLFLIFVFIGSVSSLGSVIDFSDMMILSMAFMNITGGVILASGVKNDVNEYWRKLKNGEFKTYK